ncbi:hypothetical protein [Clostridioides difficile]|uniref:hypothetical protein n=1 Tax=Clostridioides difficile TaxID=1496 RepID=UPI00038D6844|nr:hypothetical protein [Clostridioides difficile]EGT3856551.1 hypothetical protein [Clostridioides difficile]EGT3943850.1 hypothetical protein [Clostridioides difficile]EGT4099011.1 hypothetical protein [Clostridioides difficile]EGT4709951.1 hypothetical protein [Clostridioides difficile]EGT5100972.1 hypothetical protein [Clostridioides difficile]
MNEKEETVYLNSSNVKLFLGVRDIKEFEELIENVNERICQLQESINKLAQFNIKFDIKSDI